jgi:hypothetical protein
MITQHVIRIIDHLVILGERAKIWLTTLIFAQLFLTAFSLPLVVWWGLPISLLTILGNIIFNPCIILFLACSLCLFFCELFSLPSFPFAWCLERLTDAWLWLIAQGTRHALIALPKPHGCLLILMACIPLWIMYVCAHRRQRGITLFVMYLLSVSFLLKFFVIKNSALTVPYGTRSVQLVTQGKRCCIIDTQGILRCGEHNRSWVDFTLRPVLVSKLGRLTCDGIVLLKPTEKQISAAYALAERVKASVIIIPQEAHIKFASRFEHMRYVRLKGVPAQNLQNAGTESLHALFRH